MYSTNVLLCGILLVLGITNAQAQYGPQEIISTAIESPYLSIPFDIDNDGALDVVTASTQDHKLRWFKNNDGTGTFETETIINENPVFYLSIDFVDLDTDGDKDILFLENNPRNIVWLENLDGSGNFGAEQIIVAEQFDFITGVSVIDLDSDGDLDLIASITDTFIDRIVWYENTDSLGSFEDENLLIDNFQNLTPPILADINNDGNLDILTSHENNGPAKIVWFESLGNAIFGPEQEIHQFGYSDHPNSDYTHVGFMQYVDINTDDKKDIVVTTYNDDVGIYVRWLNNLDEQGEFNNLQLIPNINNSEYQFFDLTDDGDLDVLIWNRHTNEFSWAENEDSQGTFGDKKTITTNIDFPADASAGDFDSDGLLDLVSASLGDNKVAWYKNIGLGIEENNLNNFTVYPNPTKNKVKITSNQTIATVNIFNLLGQKIKEIRSANTIDLSGLDSGVYLLQIKTKTGTPQTHKIIKE